MEKKLKKLFDYQRFEKNERLEKIIKETESRYAAELSDDDLSLVNAAGDTAIIGKRNVVGFIKNADSGVVGGYSDTSIGSGGGGGGKGAGGGSGAAMSD